MCSWCSYLLSSVKIFQFVSLVLIFYQDIHLQLQYYFSRFRQKEEADAIIACHVLGKTARNVSFA